MKRGVAHFQAPQPSLSHPPGAPFDPPGQSALTLTSRPANPPSHAPCLAGTLARLDDPPCSHIQARQPPLSRAVPDVWQVGYREGSDMAFLTPQITRLAQAGLVLNNYYSQARHSLYTCSPLFTPLIRRGWS